MRPQDREDHRYSTGSINPVDLEEEILFSFLPDGNGKKLLDVGCGIGTMSLELKKRGFNVTGIDFSKVGVDKCLEKGIDARLCNVDKDGLAFDDKYFDVIWAGDIIEHVFDPIFLLEEINRVLKDDGYLLATVPNDFFLKRRWRIFIKGKSIQSGVYRKLRQCKHHTFFSWELLLYMLNEANLVIDRYAAACRKKGEKDKKIITNKTMGRLFGRKFIFSASKLA